MSILDLILVAKDSLPVYFVSKNTNTQLNDINTAAFISAVRSFAKGSLNSELVSLKLGELNITLKESEDLLFVFGTDVNAKYYPSETQFNLLVENLEKAWYKKVSMSGNVLNLKKIPTGIFETCVENFEHRVKQDLESQAIFESLNQSNTINDWNLLTISLQNKLKSFLEPVIIGNTIEVLDNDPIAPIVKNVLKLFRINENDFRHLNFEDYNHDIIAKENPDASLIIDPLKGKISGKFDKSKFLEKFLFQVLKQELPNHQMRTIEIFKNTLVMSIKTICLYENHFIQNEGKIINLLNNLESEVVRLILLILRNNRPTLHEKLVNLPIHKEWFNKW